MAVNVVGTNGNIATNYFVLVDELSARNISKTGSTEVVQQVTPSMIDPIFTFAPYGIAIVAIILFVVAFGIQLNKSIHKSKEMIMAVVIAVFAASIPSVLMYVNQGSRQVTHAGPEYTPRNVKVEKASDSSVHIAWDTDVPVYTMVRFGPAPLGGLSVRLYRDSTQLKTINHLVTADNVKNAMPYEFEIYSGNIWYDNAGKYVQFTFNK